MKKSSLFSVVALLATVAFLFTACPEEPEEETKPSVVQAGAIAGVTVPATGGTPVSAVTDGTGYTGTVTWLPEVSSTFAVNTTYTATITLSAKSGYTFDGFTGAFTVAGVSSGGLNQAASSGKWVLTAVFPATVEGDSPIPSVAIVAADLPAPVTGAAPVATITTATEYTAAVEWKPLTDKALGDALGSNDKFAVETTYAAVITLTAKSGYAFTEVPTTLTVAGVDADKAGAEVVTGLTFTAGISKTLDSSTGKLTITAIFPATDTLKITGGEIAGVTVPAEGGTPATPSISGTGYTGSVEWKKLNGNTLDTALADGVKFAGKATYVAVITLAPVSGDYVFPSDVSFSVADVADIDDTNAGDTATGLTFDNGISQAASGNNWVVHAIFPVTLGSVPATIASVAEHSDVLTVTVSGGSLVSPTSGLKAHIKNDGSAVTITTAAVPSGFTELTTNRVSVNTSGTTTITLTLPNGAAASPTGNGSQLKTSGVTVTLAADAQATQVTDITTTGPTVAISGARALAVGLGNASTLVVDNIAGTVTLGAATTLSKDVEVPAGIELIVPDATNTLSTDAHTLTVNGTVTVAASGTVTVAASGTVTAGKLVLGEGTWKATNAAATIETDKLTLSAVASAAFGADGGTTATVLTGGNTAASTFTAGTETITLTQDSNALVITGGSAATLTLGGADAGINVVAGLTITTATLDISAAGTITLPNTKVITLSNTNSVIKLGSETNTITDTPTIADVSLAGVTITAPSATGNSSAAIGTIASADDSTAGTLTASSDATLNKDTEVSSS